MNARLANRIQVELTPVTIAAAAAVMGSMAIGFIMRDLGAGVLGVGACAAALSYAAARAATRLARTLGQAVILCLGFTVTAAALNSPLSFVVVSLFFRDPYATGGAAEILGGAFLALFVGLFITVPLGIAFGVPFAVLVAATHRSSREASPSGLDRTLRSCGIWLAIVGAGCAAAAAGLRSPLGPGLGVCQALAGAGIALSLLGATAAVVALARMAARKAWIGRVRAGRVPGWSLVPVDEVAGTLDHLPTLLSTRDAPRDVLVRRCPDSGPGAYRRGAALELVALV